MSIPKADDINHSPSRDKLRKAYYSLRLELCSIINEIESDLSNSQRTTRSLNHLERTASLALNSPNEIQTYRKIIENLNRKLDAINTYDKIIIKESNLKRKENQLRNLEYENKALKLIYNNQTKGLLQYQDEIQSNENLLFNIEKILQLKEEIQSKNHEYKSTLDEVKGQLAKINIIEKKCSIIKENISYKIKQDLKPRKEIAKDTSSTNINSYVNKIKTKSKPKIGINEMKRMISKNELQSANDKSQYLNTIRKQRDKINQITQEINLISKRIYNFDRVHRLKEKEIKKKLHLIHQLSHIQQRSYFSQKSDKLKSRNGYQSARQKNYSLPKAAIAKSKLQKIFEINKLIYGNQSIVYNNNSSRETIQHNTIIMDIESLSNEYFI